MEVILESALSDAEAGHATSTIAPRLLASFCRRWLAVEDAPEFTAERISIDSVVADITGHASHGQRVRLVPEDGLGGGE